MSSWEIFTWINVGILGVGSVAVFVAFLRGLPELLARQQRPPGEIYHGEDGKPAEPARSEPKASEGPSD